jgi:hypothetical protein
MKLTPIGIGRISPFLLLILGGCAVTTEPLERSESTDQPLSAAAWHAERIRGTGAGCRFQDDASGPADAFAIAVGQDVSIVFTRLGEGVRRGKKAKKEVSQCGFTLPITVPVDMVLSNWTQTLTYGVIKPSGAAAGLGATSKFFGRRGLNLGLPDIEKVFDTDASLNVAGDTLSTGTETFDESNAKYAGWRRKWCRRDLGEVELELDGVARTWVKRASDDQQVILAVDALDMRVDFSPKFEACPPNR